MLKRRGLPVEVRVLPTTDKHAVAERSCSRVEGVVEVEAGRRMEVMRTCGVRYLACSVSIAACMDFKSVILTSERSSASNWLGRMRSASGRSDL